MSNNAVYEFMIGDFECAVVSDGTGPYFPEPVKLFFSNAPQDELSDALRQHNIQGTDIPFRVNCLFINSGNHRILVDTGVGQGVKPDFGKLKENLQLVKATPEDIDILILSHAHSDHIGGNVDQNGKLNFPNARHLISKAEWYFWVSDAAKALDTSLVTKQLFPLTNRLELLEPNAEIIPGIRLMPLPGHTPGHSGLYIESGGDTLLQLIDTVLDPIQIEHPTWISPLDMDKEKTVAVRRALFAKAAKEKILIQSYHFPFPGLGYIEAQGDGWCWRPL